MATQLHYDAASQAYTGETDRYVVRIDEATMQNTVANYQNEPGECYTAEFWIESFEDQRLFDSSLVTRK